MQVITASSMLLEGDDVSCKMHGMENGITKLVIIQFNTLV